jgi:hypothetical protein
LPPCNKKKETKKKEKAKSNDFLAEMLTSPVQSKHSFTVEACSAKI